ncbi:lytic murein transglycosylase [Sphingomonas sabuli]|uniref:Lytic murein transglycosylase n=1 Tax=Sphingomonas sabuli TaxID=2764186 RepID=A0A7G9L118_9SPHN|nr:lytic murein transglycosylase [Sphingomonas sabuli]QNM82317.1 lytic murein transglycosylase [Sphingomonas sabuli]
MAAVRNFATIGSTLVLALLAGAAVATPPLPMPPPPPDNPAFVAGPEPVLDSTGDPRVDAYRDRLLDEGGTSWRPYLVRLFAGIRADPQLIACFDEQAAIVEPADFIRHYVTSERIARGRALYRVLSGRAQAGTTPPEVRLAMWGMLSDFGDRPPQHDAIAALLVLGAHDRGARGDFQLHHAARLVVAGDVPRERLRAGDSGRLGQTAILPGRFDTQARDGNGDGRKDVWSSRADILASLDVGDWSAYPGMPVAVAVRPAQFDLSDPIDARRARALEQVNNVPANILRRYDGKRWAGAQQGWAGAYVEPYGKAGPAFLVLPPAWAVNSVNPYRELYFNDDHDKGFALAAALLADAIAGRPVPDLPAAP